LTQFLLRKRTDSAVTFTPDKGVLGRCWRERAQVIVDLERDLHPRASTKADFERLDADERFGLTWDEYQRTRRYQAVYAAPLLLRKGRTTVVAGIVSIDVLARGRFEEFFAATVDPSHGRIHPRRLPGCTSGCGRVGAGDERGIGAHAPTQQGPREGRAASRDEGGIEAMRNLGASPTLIALAERSMKRAELPRRRPWWRRLLAG
jgi:hypothetical protein